MVNALIIASAALAACCTMLAGCTSVDAHRRVEGWPALVTIEHRVDQKTMREHCARYAAPLVDPMACAEVDLSRGTCVIWYVWAEHLAHERLHCRGYDHHFGGTLQRLLDTQRRL